MRSSFFLGAFFLPLLAASQPKPSPEAETLFNSMMSQINTKHVKFIKRTAVETDQLRMSDDELKSKTTNYAVLGNISGADIEAICFLVLMQAAKSAQEDLKAIMDKVKAINEQKAKLRDALQRAKSAQGKAGLHLDSLKFLSARTAAFMAYTNVEAVKFQKSRITIKPNQTDLDNQIDQIKNDIDSMSEMGEMESLRLQMAMDRMSKMMSTLSNLLKKISDTAQSITQNLK
jgi:hypothetical protein